MDVDNVDVDVDIGKEGYLIVCDFKSEGYEFGDVHLDYEGYEYESWPIDDDVWNDASDVAEFVKYKDDYDSFFHWAFFGFGVIDAETQGYFVQCSNEFDKFCNQMDIERANGNTFPSFLPKLRQQVKKSNSGAKIVLYPLGFVLPDCSVVEKDAIMLEMKSGLDFSLFAAALILRFSRSSKWVKVASNRLFIHGIVSIPLNYYNYQNDYHKKHYSHKFSTIPRPRYRTVAKTCERILHLVDKFAVIGCDTTNKNPLKVYVNEKRRIFYLSNSNRTHRAIFLNMMNSVYNINNNVNRIILDLCGVYRNWNYNIDRIKWINEKYNVFEVIRNAIHTDNIDVIDLRHNFISFRSFRDLFNLLLELDLKYIKLLDLSHNNIFGEKEWLIEFMTKNPHILVDLTNTCSSDWYKTDLDEINLKFTSRIKIGL